MTALAIASFDRAAPFRQGVARIRAEERAIVGLWSPVPAAAGTPLEAGRGLRVWMAAAGLAGAALLYLLIWWTATQAYPFDSGDRPLHSWPAFLVAPVEFGALVAAIAGVALFLMRARLTRLHDAAFDLDEVSDAMSDRFVIAVRCDAGEDANALMVLLAGAGAVHSRVVER